MHVGENYRMGINVPGVPGIIMGRNQDVCFHFTYGFMDMVDYFIEEWKDGHYKTAQGYEPFTKREETIFRKKDLPLKMTIYESPRGVLEIPDVLKKPANGLYLSRAWSAHHQGASASLQAIYQLLFCQNAPQTQKIVSNITISANWLIADRFDNIAFQQSGLLPRRRFSGLFPLPAWDEANAWQGMVPSSELASTLNPPEKFLVTANNDVNQAGKPLSINMPMGSYRTDRISALLKQEKTFTLEDMKEIQRDLYSLQAKAFMPLITPHIPSTKLGDILRAWDYGYQKEATAPIIFETIYANLLQEVFGQGLFGITAWNTLVAETNILINYYAIFDRALLADDESWYHRESKETVFKRVIQKSFAQLDPAPRQTWGEKCQFSMTNILFNGRFPNWLGFDVPVTLEGNRATVVQGAIYHAHGRLSTFWPSYRAVTDINEPTMHTVLAGGASGRRFSKYYTAEIHDWVNYHYKILKASTD